MGSEPRPRAFDKRQRPQENEREGSATAGATGKNDQGKEPGPKGHGKSAPAPSFSNRKSRGPISAGREPAPDRACDCHAAPRSGQAADTRHKKREF